LIATRYLPSMIPSQVAGRCLLEAQRLGLEAYASDLNPVAVLINKAMIEIPPKFAGRPPVNPRRKNKQAWTTKAGLGHVVWQRTSGTMESGCAMKQKNASATCIPKPRSRKKW